MPLLLSSTMYGTSSSILQADVYVVSICQTMFIDALLIRPLIPSLNWGVGCKNNNCLTHKEDGIKVQ